MEQWTELKECKNYEISSYGRFKNKATGRIIAGTKDYAGYRKIRLYENEMHFKDYRTHLLVARYFVLNDSPETKTFVQHIDSDRSNARADNLEWIVPMRDKRSDALFKGGYPICEYDLNGKFVRTWKNASAVAQIYTIASRTIYGAASRQIQTAYGRQWRFYEETKGEAIEDIASTLPLNRLKKIQEKIKNNDYNYYSNISQHFLYSLNETLDNKESEE